MNEDMQSDLDGATALSSSGDPFEHLRRGFRGELLRRGDPGYDVSRRIWNGSIDRHPSLIARCAGTSDVISAVKAARACGLTPAVRGGGHSFPGYSLCDGGMVIDLGLMPLSNVPMFQLGGAVGRVHEGETAFSGRAVSTLNINGSTETDEGFDEERVWVRDLWSALEPYHTSVYVNFLMDEDEERIRQSYGPERFARLKALKRRYDPDNFFRLNQNIVPA